MKSASLKTEMKYRKGKWEDYITEAKGKRIELHPLGFIISYENS